MKTTELTYMNHIRNGLFIFLGIGFAALLLVGCRSNTGQNSSKITAGIDPVAPTFALASTPATTSTTSTGEAATSVRLPIRIKAGGTAAFKDSSGNLWQPDAGFDGGDVIERPEVTITNTADQAIYQAERFSMNSFTQKLPNGKYIVKLHFAETYDGIDGPGQRVFTFNVQGHEFKDFDVWAKAGGPLRAYVEVVPVEINNGRLEITFTSNIENPEINGIEIIPQS